MKKRLLLGMFIAVLFLCVGMGESAVKCKAAEDENDLEVILFMSNCNHSYYGEGTTVNRFYDKNDIDGCHAILENEQGYIYSAGNTEKLELPTSGEGWSYDSKTNTLTLDNFTGQGIFVEGIGNKASIFTIKLIGDNYLKGTITNKCAIQIYNDTVDTIIEGPGTLTVKGEKNSNSMLMVFGKLTMKNTCKIDATSVYKTSGVISSAIRASYINMEKDCVIKAASKDYAVSFGNIGLSGVIEGTIIASSSSTSEYISAFNVGTFTLGEKLKVYQGSSEAKAKLMGYSSGDIWIGEGYYKYTSILPEGSTPSGKAEELTVAKAAITSVKSSKAGYAKLKWKKVSGANGYEIYYSAEKNGTYKKLKTITKAKTITYTKKKLASGKTYYFKLRAYKTVDGKKVYGKYSVVKSVKVK